MAEKLDQMNSLEGLIRKKLFLGGADYCFTFRKGKKCAIWHRETAAAAEEAKKTGQGRGQEGNGKMGLEKNNPLSRLKIGLAVGG